MTTDGGAYEALPELDPLEESDPERAFGKFAPPRKNWDAAGICTVVTLGVLPVVAEFFFRGTADDHRYELVNASTVGYSLFAMGAAAAVQCAQNKETRAWTAVTFPAVVCGLIIGLAYGGSSRPPNALGWTLVIIELAFTSLAIFVGWRPRKSG